MDSELQQLVNEIQGDVPTIDAAVKNLITLLVGSRDFEMADALIIAKALLKAVQQTPLLSVDDYCLKYPQLEEQSGLDRLNEVCRVKTVFGLREKVLIHQGKISKLFGKKYFLWSKSLPDVLVNVRNDLKANSQSILDEDAEKFLVLFENSLSVSDEPSQDYSDLIWCADFTAALTARKNKRQEEVKQRMDRLEQEMREAVSTTSEEPRVEELQDSSSTGEASD